MSRKPRKLSGSSRERTNHNDREIFVCDVGRYRPGTGRSLVAIDAIRSHGGRVDIGFAQKPCASALWAVDGGVGEISDSFFVAGQYRKPPGVVPWEHRNERRILRCNGGG